MKRTILFLGVLFILSGCASKDKSVSEVFASWPVGTTVWADAEDERLQAIKDVGIEYLELDMTSPGGMSADQVREHFKRVLNTCSKLDLKVWSVHIPYGHPFDPSELNDSLRQIIVERIGRYIEVAGMAKPQKLILHASVEPIPDEDREARIQQAIKSYNELSVYAEKIGAQLLVEDLPRTCIGNISKEIVAIVDGTSANIGACFDTNHVTLESPQEFALRVGDRIKSLHVCDFDGINEKHWVMGDGVIKWEELIEALVEIGYDGVFMFEVGRGDLGSDYYKLTESWNQLLAKLEAREKNK